MSATVDTAIDDDANQLLALLHLSSPALPIGAFAYSSGLESAIELGWVNTEADLQSWLEGMLQGMAHLDIPVLLRLCSARAQNDKQQLQYWSDFLRANRESYELLFEDEQQALALVRLLKGQALDVSSLPIEPAFMAVYSLAAEHWGLNPSWAALGYLWSWLENQLTVASKTIPLGQTSAQRLLIALKPALLAHFFVAQQLEDEQLGWSLPGQVHASCIHETQYSRLFRS
ncbi:urease accessory protein UreF [Psychrobacter frigidicola]|uniref:Urease accessory protein UreF n=1 Tax=Psychrobacter frigidicola TaxID=45611 RepID=A0A5C7A6Y7_9GAMM|nr:urease accessory UreF family protein [Psychrobacter frigidicola]TXD96497.1 urease accessory protein UreF [Psychrobacter frigidicola]